MKQFRDSLSLTAFELRHSIVSYIILSFILLFFLILIIPSLPSYITTPVMGFDFQLFFALCLLPTVVKRYPFKSINVGSYVYTSPFHLLVKQLPISSTTYITYHLIYRFLLSVVITSIFLGVLYPFWSISVSFYHYIVFIFIWISITFMFNLLDVYSQFGYHFFIWLGVIILIVSVSFFAYVLLFYTYTFNDGFVFWTLYIAENYPLYATIFSFLFILLNIIFWYKILQRKLANMDFYY